MAITQPIKWHGGKHYLAPWIIQTFPPHLHYVEPFFGGGSVLLAKDPEGISEVVNDLDGRLTNFWRTLKNIEAFKGFARDVAATPFSEQEFNEAARRMDSAHPRMDGDPPSVPEAVDFFVVARQSRQGLMKDFATLSRNRVRRGMNEQASAWLNAVEGLPAVHARLSRVVIFNRPALSVITSQDGPDTLFYIDAPYPHSTRSATGSYGEFEMTDDQHQELADTLGKCVGKVAISTYYHPIYDKLRTEHGWRRLQKLIDNKASSSPVKGVKTECLYFNYQLPETSVRTGSQRLRIGLVSATKGPHDQGHQEMVPQGLLVPPGTNAHRPSQHEGGCGCHGEGHG